jgi:hypothetical protein
MNNPFSNCLPVPRRDVPHDASPQRKLQSKLKAATFGNNDFASSALPSDPIGLNPVSENGDPNTTPFLESHATR